MVMRIADGLRGAFVPACHTPHPDARYALPMPTDHGCGERERDTGTERYHPHPTVLDEQSVLAS